MDGAICVGAVTTEVIEGGDSNKEDENFELADTRSSKSLGKRGVASVQCVDSAPAEIGGASATKEPKISSL